jgi:hypothetical protein
MTFFRVVLYLFLLLGFNSLSAQDTSNKAFNNFWHPLYLGKRLNYCSIDKKLCGKPLADQYCKTLGYDTSSKQVKDPNVGLTHFLNTRAQCKGWKCNGFINITCVTHLSHSPAQSYYYREKSFYYPRYANYRVNWCYKDHRNCGKAAAQSFCKRIGYMKAKQFIKENSIAATRTIGSQELCFGQCEGFKKIICYR